MTADKPIPIRGEQIDLEDAIAATETALDREEECVVEIELELFDDVDATA